MKLVFLLPLITSAMALPQDSPKEQAEKPKYVCSLHHDIYVGNTNFKINGTDFDRVRLGRSAQGLRDNLMACGNIKYFDYHEKNEWEGYEGEKSMWEVTGWFHKHVADWCVNSAINQAGGKAEDSLELTDRCYLI